MKNMMEYKGYYGSVEYSNTDNVLFGKAVGMTGLIFCEGDSVQALKTDFEEAIDDYLEICAEEVSM